MTRDGRISTTFGARILAEIDAEAERVGAKRPEIVRALVDEALRSRAYRYAPGAHGYARPYLEDSPVRTGTHREHTGTRREHTGTPPPPHTPPPLEGREGREPPTSSSGGARLGGLAAGRRGREGTALPSTGLAAKVHALASWQKLGLRLKPKVDKAVTKFAAGHEAGSKRPVSERESRLIGRAYRKHAPRWGNASPSEAVSEPVCSPDPESRPPHREEPLSPAEEAEAERRRERDWAAAVERHRNANRLTQRDEPPEEAERKEHDVQRTKQALDKLRGEVEEGGEA